MVRYFITWNLVIARVYPHEFKICPILMSASDFWCPFLARPFHFKPVMLQYVIFEVTSVLVLIGVSAFDDSALASINS